MDGTTIFIGENNSGKSNMLRAIALPLYSEDNSLSKNLSWEDINTEAKEQYYAFLNEHRSEIIDGTLDKDAFAKVVPYVSVELHFSVNNNELYYVKDIAFGVEDSTIQYGILYKYSIESKDKLLDLVKGILTEENVVIENCKRNLLPISSFSHSIIVPNKNSKETYDTLRQLKYNLLL